MASFQDKLLFTASTPKLPNINSSSIASLGAGASRKPQSIQWLGPLKQRLDYSINYSGNPHVEDVEELSKEITMLMIAALQPNASKQIWLDLNHVLAVVYPYKEFLRTASISHYVERLFLHYSSNMEMLFDVPILDSLQSMFPYDIERLRSRHGTAASSPERFVTRILTQSTKPDLTPEIDQSEPAPQLILPDGRNPYSLIRRGDEPERHFKTKKLTLNTLSDNIGFVATETAANESKWQENDSTTVAAIKVDLPMSFEHVSEYGSSQMSSRHSLDLSHLRQSTSPRKKADDFVSMTGRQAVELFLKHKHLHKVKFIYLNKSKNRHYRPYDLVSVPRDMVENEHFIFSSFGVLHIYPEGNHSDTLTLADWNKHAVLWNAMQKIPFFRNYLIRKTFSSWIASVKRLRYNRIRDRISRSLIHAVPDFGSSLLHVFRLITELSEVKLLPNKPSTALQYTIMEFESDKHKLKLEATDLLGLFFQYCKKVVDMTRQSCFEQLKYYEYQAKQSKPLFCKESLYIQRRKREARANNLRKFQLITRRIPTFVSLVDQAISVHLVALARTAVTQYVENLLSHLEADDADADVESLSTMTESHVTSKEATSSNRDQLEVLASVFATKFVFNKESHLLEMQPSPEKFKAAIQSSVNDTLDLMCGCAHSMHVVIMTSQLSTRPGSAPASIGSSGSDPSDVSGRSSISSMTSQSESVQRENANNAAIRNETAGTAEASGKLTALQVASGLTDPAVSPRPLPTKEEDAEGVTTPDMMLNSGAEGTLGMVVGGQGLMGHHTPLDQSKLKDKMLEDPEIVEAIARQNQLLSDAIKQVTSFCDEHNSWLLEIRTFASTWNDEVLKMWAGKPARIIEEQLNKIKSWTEQVKNMDRALVSNNRLIYVDCRAPYVSLVPALNSIFKKLIAGAVSEAKRCALEVTGEAKDALKTLKNKNTDMRSFAEYARKVTMSQMSKDSMTEKVTYIRSLYEVVRMTYRQLTQDEEKLEERVKSTWEAFLYQLKDANNFVANQRPIIMKQLDSVYQAQYAKAQCVAAKASAGIAVDPTFDANEVISQLSSWIDEFHGLHERLKEISRYRESVCGENYNLVDLGAMREGMEARLNLWKNVSVTGYTIAEWKAVVFKKFTVQHAIDKVHEWQQISSTFVDQLPPNDPVFNSWTQTLDDIGKELPLLAQLSSEAMKARHWREVFTGMGETYEADWTFTVEDLLSYKPSQYTSTIKRIHRNATAEFSLEQLLRKIKRKWEERQFQLAKHIYVVQVPRESETPETTNAPKPQHKDQKLFGLTEEVFIDQENDSETFTLVGVDELLRDVSDSHVTLQGMLQSKHAVEVKCDAEIWSDTLQQIGEIVHLWISCQDKWMYLNKVFNAEANLRFQFPHLAIQWKVVDQNYREFINAMASDPKVLSVMSRLHGQKGWRDLQGDALRRHLVSCILKEEDMVRAISSLLDNFRAKFPRLYFLCDEDCVRLLGISRQPKALLPYVRKCFSGVKSVTFSLPKAIRTKHVQGGLTSLDLELHSHRLQATAILGNHKEILAIEPLSAHSDVTVWLKMLEKRIESSLREQLKELIELKVQNDLPSILEALSDVYNFDTTLDETSPESLQYRHWLLSYPSQVVLLANSVMWFKKVEKFVKEGARKADFEFLRKETVHQLKQFVQATQESLSATSRSSSQKRLQSVLSNLTIQTVHHRDVLKSLERCQVKSINSYEWQSLLKHTADITDYSNLGLKREEVIEGYPHSDLTKAAIVGDCYVSQLERRTPYGYEFYGMQKGSDVNIGGICAPTVITPITERCMLNLSVAFQLCQVGCVFGPRNVGKSHAVAELARAFGRQFVNLTCSEQLTQEIIKRTLCGLVETGSWLCFDHAQRLHQTTLSLLSQSIKQIQEGYRTVKQSFNTRYTVHAYDASHRIKRSNSVITLHKTGASSPWQPQVESSFIRSLGRLSYEESDVRMTSSNYQGHPDLCLALDDKLLTVRDGFGIFMTFATESGCGPTVPDSLKLIYRPTCLIKPDVSKLIEVWLQSAGFSDSANLTQKLTLAHNLLQANSDRISSDQELIDPESSQLASVGISTLRSVITLAAKLNTRLQSQQRSRTQSLCDSETPSGGGGYSPSVTSSSTSVSRSSRRSEMILSSHNEEMALVNALIVTCTMKLGSPECITRLKEMLRPIFPTISRPLAPSSLDSKLAGAIHQQMVTDGFQPASDWIEKACQLFTLLRLNQSVVVAGPAGSGKTTICKILAKALNSLSSETLIEASINTNNTSSTMKSKSMKSGMSASEMSDPRFHSEVFDLHGDGFGDLLDVDGYGRVDSTTIFPNAHNISDIFGFHKPKSQIWKDGLLVKLLKDCTVIHKVGSRSKGNDPNRKTLQPSAGSPRNATTEPELPNLKKWIVMDGEIHPTWSDNISCLLDHHRKARLSNMDEVSIPQSTSFIFELSNFASASPAMAARCAILYCDIADNWRNIALSWLDTAYGQFKVTQSTIRIWRDLVEDLVPPVVDFLRRSSGSLLNTGLDHTNKVSHVAAAGVHEMTSFINILSSCLTAHKVVRNTSTLNQDDVTISKRSHRNSTNHDDAQSTRTRASSNRSRLDDSVPESCYQLAMNLFAFSFVWGFGGQLQERDIPGFDQVVRNAFAKSRHDISFPRYESVFDYFVDEEFGRFSLWEDKIDLRPRAIMQNGSQYVPLHQLERYAYLSSVLLHSRKSVLLVGEAGCGKSSLVKNLLQADLDITKISMSPGLSASHFQRLIESKALPTSKQHNLGLMAHPNAVIASRNMMSQIALFFLDDLSCARSSHDQGHGVKVQPTLELLRQIITTNGVYELDRLLFKSLEAEIAFVATATTPGLPGSGLSKVGHTMSPRLTRNFTVLNFLKPSKDAILSMHHSGVQSWLEEFPAYSLVRHYDLSQAIISGAYDLYSSISSHLKPSPTNPHYVFSLHDISHVMQGLFQLTPRTRGRPMPIRRRGANEQRRRPGGGVGGARQVGRFMSRSWGDGGSALPPMMRTVIRLWLHECSRVFHDRLSSDEDRRWFSKTLHDQLKKHFCTSKVDRAPSPDKMRIVKTPVPSGGGATPLPSHYSSGSLPSSSLGGASDSFLQSSPEQQTGYDGDRSMGSESGDQIGIEMSPEADYDVTKESTIRHREQIPYADEDIPISTSDASSLASANKTSDFYETDETQSGVSKVETSTSSNTAKDLRIAIPSASSLRDSSLGDEFSETTTNQVPNESSMTSGDLESRPMTEMTQDDDAKSTMTGYTTEAETASNSVMTMEGGSSDSESSDETNHQRNESAGVTFLDPVPHPSGVAPEKMEKPARPQHGGGAKLSRPGGAKLGVTFMPGLVDDADDAVNMAGPLVSMEQVLDDSEDSTSIIFTHSILPPSPDQKGVSFYTESTLPQLGGALKLCLDTYNKQSVDDKQLELVFFGQSIRHIASLSRVTSMKQGGHALLLSASRFAGRRSLTRLMAYHCGATLMCMEDVDVDNLDEKSAKSKLRSLIKQASFEAGTQNNKVILLVEEPCSTDPDCLDDVCSLIRDGQCPALYTNKELAKIASEIAPALSSVLSTSDSNLTSGRMTAVERLDQYLDTFFSRVLTNLHVVVLLPYPQDAGPVFGSGDSQSVLFHKSEKLHQFHEMLRRCPDLLTRFSCVDLYRSWDESSWNLVAKYYLESYAGLNTGEDARLKLPWSKRNPVQYQVTCLSFVMSFIHQDALERLKTLHPNAEDFANPLIFEQMIQLFVGIARMVRSKEIAVIQRYEQALTKVREAEASIEGYYDDRVTLLPRLEDARARERSWKRHVEEERQEYAEARQRCSIEEDNIEILELELERLKYDSTSSSNKMNPLFEAARDAVNALSEKSLDEMKRYKSPPESTSLVIGCLCHMFKVSPANWETGKALISRDGFFQELEYYDKDNIPENIYYTMMRYVQMAEFLPSNIIKGSRAAATLCSWVHAIYKYAETTRILQPIRDAQRNVEKKLEDAQITLGTKRVRCNQIKKELDAKIQSHKNASQMVKQLEKELKTLESRISKAEELMENMQEHVDHWRSLRSDASSRLDSAVGDSALVAACIAYQGCMNVEQGTLALQQWKNACVHGYVDGGELKVHPFEQAREVDETTTTTDTDSLWGDIDEDSGTSSVGPRMFLRIRDNFDPLDVLSTSSEQRLWHRGGLSRDRSARLDALRLHALSLYQDLAWCLIFDPDDRAQTWLNAIHDKVRKEMQDETIAPATPSLDRSRPPTSSESKSESIREEEEGISLSSLSDAALRSEAVSAAETEVTISVSATGTVRSEVTKEQGKSPKGVRFADVEDVEEEDGDEETVEQQDSRESLAQSVEELPPPSFPLDQLWICKAIDPDLDRHLASALLHGSCLLITHVEQADVPELCVSRRLAAKQQAHPDFRLYLATSLTPLEFATKSPGLHSLQVHKFASSDLSLNEAGLLEQLEHFVLAQERSEFEAQRRLMEADIFHLEEMMEQLQDNLLSRVAGVEGPILADTGILQALQTYKKDTETTISSLKETTLMESNLMQKKFDLSFVATHGLRLYEAFRTTATVRPLLYKMTSSQFVALYCARLRSHVRGKANAGNSATGGSSGSLIKSRVVELKQGLTECLIDFAEQRMFSQDVTLLTTLVSLSQMVATGKMAEAEMKEFVECADTEPLQQLPTDLANLHKPVWMAGHIWQQALLLTHRHREAFQHFAWSLSVNQRRWREYLHSPPVLLAKVPCNKLHSLTLGQKALLWKVLRPKVFAQTIQDMNASVLGGVSARSNVFDFDEVVQKAKPCVPCCFVLPENPQDSTYLPAIHILEKAKAKRIVCVERSAEFSDDLGDTMEECMLNGHWLLLSNCELATRWPHKFVALLTYMANEHQVAAEAAEGARHPTSKVKLSILAKVVTTLRSISTSTDKLGGEKSVNVGSIDTVEHEAAVHPHFRLWIVTRNKPNLVADIPLQILRSDNVFTVETPVSHKDLVHSTHKLLSNIAPSLLHLSLANKHPVIAHTDLHVPYNVRAAMKCSGGAFSPGKSNIIIQLSMLHSTLLERLYFQTSAFVNPYALTDADVVNALQSLMMVENLGVAKALCTHAIVQQVPELRDMDITRELSTQCIQIPRDNAISQGLIDDIKIVLHYCQKSKTSFDMLLQKPDLAKLGLTMSSEINPIASWSKEYSTILTGACQSLATTVGKLPNPGLNSLLVKSTETLHIKRTIESLLNQVMETTTPQYNKHIFSPTMMEFYSSEVQKLKTVIAILQNDLSMCLAAIKGGEEITTTHEVLIGSFAKDQIPDTWWQCNGEIFKYHRGHSLLHFVSCLDKRVNLLHKYMEIATQSSQANVAKTERSNESVHSTISQSSSATQTLLSYNLSVFFRPDLFLQSALCTVAKSKHHDPHKYQFKKQFVIDSEVVQQAGEISLLPFQTIYIEGLHIHKAHYERRSSTLQQTPSHESKKMPLLCLKAEKVSQYKRPPSTGDFYNCPVWLCNEKNPDMFSDSSVIIHVPIATSHPPLQWFAKGTSLLSRLDDK